MCYALVICSYLCTYFLATIVRCGHGPLGLAEIMTASYDTASVQYWWNFNWLKIQTALRAYLEIKLLLLLVFTQSCSLLISCIPYPRPV